MNIKYLACKAWSDGLIKGWKEIIIYELFITFVYMYLLMNKLSK